MTNCGIIDRQTCRNRSAGAVDVETDILIGILALQIEELGDNKARGGVVDLLRKDDDPVIQQPGKNIIRTLAAAGLLDYIWH